MAICDTLCDTNGYGAWFVVYCRHLERQTEYPNRARCGSLSRASQGGLSFEEQTMDKHTGTHYKIEIQVDSRPDSLSYFFEADSRQEAIDELHTHLEHPFYADKDAIASLLSPWRGYIATAHTSRIADMVAPIFGCPFCGERRMDVLAWNSDCTLVSCPCGANYDPMDG